MVAQPCNPLDNPRRTIADINKQVGARIRRYRTKKDLTQEELAFEVALHRAYIGQIERGEKNIGVQNLQKIAEALGVRISKLLED